MTDVSTLHPMYMKYYADWEVMRDCIKGQRHIKSKSEKYLPKSGGQKAMEKISGCDTGQSPYHAYKFMARFPDLTRLIVHGFAGLATRKPWDIQNLPAAMEKFTKNAGDGLSFNAWQARLIGEGLETGRYVLFPDADENGDNLGINWFPTESVINWKTEHGMPELIVLKERAAKPERSEFSHETEDQYRVIKMVDGICVVEIYDKKGALVEEIEQRTIADNDGYCPLFVGGTVKNDWEIESPPLLGVAEAALSYYMLSAQQRWAIRATCDPTFLARGFEVGSIKFMGGGGLIEDPDKDVAIDVIEPTGNGIEKATAEMQRELDIAKEQSHHLADKSSVEASSSLRQRMSSKTATLKTIDGCAAQAFESSLNQIARMLSLPDNIEVTPSYDYTDDDIDAVTLRAISEVAERGHLPESAVVEYARSRGALDGLSDAEVQSQINADNDRREQRVVSVFGPTSADGADPVNA